MRDFAARCVSRNRTSREALRNCREVAESCHPSAAALIIGIPSQGLLNSNPTLLSLNPCGRIAATLRLMLPIMQHRLKQLQFISFAIGAMVIVGSGAARGDETLQTNFSQPKFPQPEIPDRASCRALGPGFQPMPGGCVRIKGYIAVGSQPRFVG